MFRGCPKPNGWFGCFFTPNGESDITLIGITGTALAEGMKLHVKCHEEIKDGRIQYYADEIQVITSGYTATTKYLSGPDFPGIGLATAELIYINFGNNSLSIIENYPDKLKALGISDDKIRVLHEGICNHDIDNQLRKIMPWAKPKFLKQLIMDYQSDILNTLKKDPYILYFNYGIPFAKADSTASVLGVQPDSDQRIHACIHREFNEIVNSTKDVFLNLSDNEIWNKLVYGTVNYINHPAVTATRVSDEIKNVKSLITTREYGFYQLYDVNMYDAECLCISILSKLLKSKSLVWDNTSAKNTNYLDDCIREYENSNKILDEDQKNAVRNAITNRISIINGGPGRGKTTVINCILYVWSKFKCFSSNAPILAAPTGRAVKRMMESVNNSYYYFGTIAHFITKDGHSSKRPPEYTNNLFIIDEASMISLQDASEILELAKDCQVVFVGDIDQLPSIQPGSFFRDICSLDIMPITTLKTCYRTSTRIITDNADKINNGLPANKLKYDFDAFTLYPQQHDDEAYVDDIINIYKQRLKNGVDFNEICVLAPMKKCLTGVNNLNIKLQALLNPEQIQTGKNTGAEVIYTKRGCPVPNTYYSGVDKEYTRLRIGDKIIYTVNDTTITYYNTLSGTAGKGIYNGDCGILTEYHVPDNDNDEPYLSFKTDDGKIYHIDESDFENIQLAYAITIHKSQGCEYDIIIMSMQCALAHMPPDMDFASRNLLYTGITRAKNAVEIVGSVDSLNRCIDTLPRSRNSLLYEKLNDRLHNLISS